MTSPATSTSRSPLAPRLPRSATEAVLRVATVAALVVDVVLHLRLAPAYQLGFPDGIGMGNMFRLAAAAAAVAAVVLIWLGTRAAYLLALLVLGSAFVAVLLYTYVDVPTIWIFPGMYEPAWSPDKTRTAVAEGIGTVTAALGLAVTTRDRRRT